MTPTSTPARDPMRSDSMNPDVMILDEPPPQDPRPTAGAAIALAVLGAAVVASFWPNLLYLGASWWDEPNNSHGFFVGPIAAFILWKRRGGLKGLVPRPNAAGWAALVAVLALRAYLYQRNEKWAENATLPLAIAALTLALCGWKITRWAAPALGFLAFLLPIPAALNQTLAGPLQTVATIASMGLLQLLGLPVVNEGHVIYVGTHPLEVAQACNGLSMLLSFTTLITAVIILSDDRPAWQRIGLLASTIPIALIANVLRITATACCYRFFGEDFGKNVAHAGAGWAMMLIGLALVWAELRVFAWLVVQEQEAHAATILIAPAMGPRVIKK